MRETTRRALLSRAALAVPAAALPVAAIAAAAEVPDPHPAWLAAILAKRDLINTRGGGDEETDALFQEMIELEDRLYETPARTLAGVRAQLAACVAAVENATFGHYEEGCLETALAALDRLTGEATA